MKKYLFVLSALVVFASCEKTSVSYNSAPAEIYAAIGNSGTKVTFGEISYPNYPHVWEQTDDISVFYKSEENKLYRNASTGGSDHSGYARFKDTGYSVATKTGTLNACYAIYPFDAGNAVSEAGDVATYSFTIPHEQKYRAGAYGTSTTSTGSYGCVVLLGIHTDSTVDENYFNFYNTGCMIKLPIKLAAGASATKVTKVVLESNDSENIAGPASATFSGNPLLPSVDTTSANQTSITLDCSAQTGGGVSLSETATDFYIFLLPSDFKRGFTVKVYDGENIKSIAVANGPVTETGGTTSVFQRNRVVCMSDVEVNPSKLTMSISVVSWVDGGSTDLNLQ